MSAPYRTTASDRAARMKAKIDAMEERENENARRSTTTTAKSSK